eukprot:44842-Pelagomonas_calceolata.AAC.5
MSTCVAAAPSAANPHILLAGSVSASHCSRCWDAYLPWLCSHKQHAALAALCVCDTRHPGYGAHLVCNCKCALTSSGCARHPGFRTCLLCNYKCALTYLGSSRSSSVLHLQLCVCVTHGTQATATVRARNAVAPVLQCNDTFIVSRAHEPRGSLV